MGNAEFLKMVTLFVFMERHIQGFNMLRYFVNLGGGDREWEMAMSPNLFGHGMPFWQGIYWGTRVPKKAI